MKKTLMGTTLMMVMLLAIHGVVYADYTKTEKCTQHENCTVTTVYKYYAGDYHGVTQYCGRGARGSGNEKHKWTTSIKAATCLSTGTKTYTCTACKGSYSETIAKTSHNYADATCAKPKTCKTCGATSGSALGHDYKFTSCITPDKCTRCDQTNGSPLGHPGYSQPTCTENSVCIRCYEELPGTKLGHNYTYEYESGSVEKHAKMGTCTRCKNTTEVIEKHNFDSNNKCTKCEYKKVCNHSYAAATCTTPKKCTKCGETSGSKLGHDYKFTSCITPDKCTRCGQTNGSPLGHPGYSKPTCTENSVCIRCYEELPGTKLGHNYTYEYESGSVEKHAKMGTCTRCKNTTEVIEKHDFDSNNKCTKCEYKKECNHSYAAATCTTPKICKRCGATLGSALGHDYKTKTIKAATCEATGVKADVCTRCGAETNRGPIMALGHNFEGATCYDEAECTRCGEWVEALGLGHDLTEATCTENSFCKRCYEEIPFTMIDHDFRFKDVVSRDNLYHIEIYKCTMCYYTIEVVKNHYFIEGVCYGCRDGKIECNHVLGLKDVVYSDENYHTEIYKCTECDEWIETEKEHEIMENNKCFGCGWNKDCVHSYKAATCLRPEICTKCGQTRGEELDHDYRGATCLKDPVCARCGEVDDKDFYHNYAPATCTEDEKCIVCGKKGYKTATGHLLYNDCTEDGICETCGAFVPKREHVILWKDTYKIDDVYHENWFRCREGDFDLYEKEEHTFEGTNKCTACGYIKEKCEHNYTPATCLEPEICTKCGQTRGMPIGHPGFTQQTCTQESRCVKCGVLRRMVDFSYYRESPVSDDLHNFVLERKEPIYNGDESEEHRMIYICSVCKKYVEGFEGHKFGGTTQCKECGYEKNSGHDYTAATCFKPATCIKCGETAGNALGHDYQFTSCVTPDKCTRCGQTTGTPSGHPGFSRPTFTEDSVCIRCGEVQEGTRLKVDVESITVPNISNLRITLNTPKNSKIYKWEIEYGEDCINLKNGKIELKKVGNAKINGFDQQGVIKKTYFVKVYKIVFAKGFSCKEGTTIGLDDVLVFNGNVDYDGFEISVPNSEYAKSENNQITCLESNFNGLGFVKKKVAITVKYHGVKVAEIPVYITEK